MGEHIDDRAAGATAGNKKGRANCICDESVGS